MAEIKIKEGSCTVTATGASGQLQPSHTTGQPIWVRFYDRNNNLVVTTKFQNGQLKFLKNQ